MAGSAGNNSSPGTAGTTGTAGDSGSAGTTGSGGTTGGGGDTGAAGSTGVFGDPACLSTVMKGGPCTATDQQSCFKTCGPESKGIKEETCTTAGTYAEMTGCTFNPALDYACYKIPTAINTVCPVGVQPQATKDCDVPYCTLCNSLQGMSGGQYLDSGGAGKVGWCVCREADSNGKRVWSCASDTAWPCPLNSGC
jgi:hypothetical protein